LLVESSVTWRMREKMLTRAEQDELDALQGFMDHLGATEMSDEDFDRWKVLIRKKQS
jgi:hypothetical protein